MQSIPSSPNNHSLVISRFCLVFPPPCLTLATVGPRSPNRRRPQIPLGLPRPSMIPFDDTERKCPPVGQAAI